jgi:CRISPR/Cas system-associated exonuclease Cas4 (RecB family)
MWNLSDTLASAPFGVALRQFPVHLSKSKFVAGVQCLKRLYLEVHSPELASEPDEGALSVMEQGQQVGIEAQKAFPGGVLVDADHEHLARALTITRDLVRNPDVPAIFEATFDADNILVRVDILERRTDGSMRIVEVKSSTKLKDHYRFDIGIQKHVVDRAGLNVSAACLMHLNRDYVYQGGEYERDKLFRVVEITPELAVDDDEIRSRAEEQLRILSDPEPPDVSPGPQCTDPYLCEFFDQCNQPVPADHVSSLPRIGAKKIEQLAAMAVSLIRDIPDDFPLSAPQRNARDAVTSGELWVNPEIATELNGLKYPLCFMDFETVYPALPRYPGLRPYDHLPFQWSVHRIESPGAQLQHHEYLADNDSDPRIPFVESLISALRGAGSIVVYYQPFEKTRLQELAGFLPAYATAIDEILSHVWDLLPCVRRNVYHPEFAGSYSLKAVLPALVPDMTYEGMEVASGVDAPLAYVRMIDPATPEEERQQIRNALLAYCRLDTLALARLVELLSGVAGA